MERIQGKYVKGIRTRGSQTRECRQGVVRLGKVDRGKYTRGGKTRERRQGVRRQGKVYKGY